MAGIKVKVTYAKRRRLADHGKIQSSPLEILKLDHDNISREEMVRRMLKRSRRTLRMVKYGNNACPTQQERTPERVKRSGGRSRDRDTIQESPSSNVRGFECAERVSSGVMTEIASRPLDSPCRGAAGPPSPSPTKTLREPRWTLKENDTRRVSRDCIAPALDVGRRSPTKSITRQRHPSGPSTAYMRSQGIPETLADTIWAYLGALMRMKLPNVSVPSITDEVMDICDTGAKIAKANNTESSATDSYVLRIAYFLPSEDFEIGPDSHVKSATGITDGNGICPPHGDPNPSAAYKNECRDSLNYSTASCPHFKILLLENMQSPCTMRLHHRLRLLQPNSSSTRQASTRVGKQGSPSRASLKVSRERPQRLVITPYRPSRFTSPTKAYGRDALPDEVTQIPVRDLGGTCPNLDCLVARTSASSENGLQSTSRRACIHSSSAHINGAVFNVEKAIALKGKHTDNTRISSPTILLARNFGGLAVPGMISSQSTGVKKAVHFAETQQPAKAIQCFGFNWKEAPSDELNLVAGKMWNDWQAVARCSG
ncbi:hypothetical protein BKA83DRAFT_15320 [Pisolithus microcarpus]|nr:hypothetical protein BKA83DRAFT_15320 [Pisolithus microcarpus]